MSAIAVKSGSRADESPGWLEVVRQQVGSLRYVVVQVVVHDSPVTQIDKTGRVRLKRFGHSQLEAGATRKQALV